MLRLKLRPFLHALEKRMYTPQNIAVYLRKCGVEVGENCFIAPTGLETQIDPALLKIGNHVAIATGVSILNRDDATWVFEGDARGPGAYGPVVIHDNCFIGYRAIIYPNVRIGPNSVVGAGSVVTSDVPPNTLVMGVPARPFGSLDRYRDKCMERWEQQRPPGAVIEPGTTWWTSRHMAENRELLRKHLLALFHDRLT
jgi:acetyltransferase-like isoleucine patch superfamily enzyme